MHIRKLHIDMGRDEVTNRFRCALRVSGRYGISSKVLRYSDSHQHHSRTRSASLVNRRVTGASLDALECYDKIPRCHLDRGIRRLIMLLLSLITWFNFAAVSPELVSTSWSTRPAR